MDEEGKITVRGVRNESARVYARRLTISDMVTLQQTGEFDLQNAIREELNRLKEKERPDFCYTGEKKAMERQEDGSYTVQVKPGYYEITVEADHAEYEPGICATRGMDKEYLITIREAEREKYSSVYA